VAAIVLVVLAAGQLLRMRGSGTIAGSEDGAEEVSEMKVGATLPDFALQQFGGSLTTASKLSGKVFLINFWATWCEACLVEMPSIVETRRMYKDKGFDVVAINVDETPDLAVPNALSELKIDFPVYVDVEGKLAQIFEVNTIPLTVLMDSDRKILMIHNGESDWNSPEFRTELERWLQI
jgi:thiol-disulfide isomerase/thioredoxin